MSEKNMNLEVLSEKNHKNLVYEENCFFGCTTTSVDVNDIELEVVAEKAHKNLVDEENCFFGCTTTSVDVNDIELDSNSSK